MVYLDAEERRWVDEMGSNNLFFVYGSGDQPRSSRPQLTGSILPGRHPRLAAGAGQGAGLRGHRAPHLGPEWREGAADGRITEVFGCGTAAVITPIGGVKHAGGDVRIGDGEPGPVSLRLRSLLTDIQRGTAPDTHSWMRTLFTPGLRTARVRAHVRRRA